MAVRIQRKRTKGWKMPGNTIYVGRPTKWGNPLKLQGDAIYINASHRRKILDPWVWLCFGDESDLIDLYRLIVTDRIGRTNLKLESPHDVNFWISHFQNFSPKELKGKDLACFCPLNRKCHADVLIELANKH